LSPKGGGTELANCDASEADINSVQPSHTITLSDEMTLAYVLNHSGCTGRLSVGRVERAGPDQVKVYDSYGELFEYVSGAQLRSWCVLVRDGQPFDGWGQIHPIDAQRFGSFTESRGLKT
jgi:hypothetical protein